MIFNLNEERDFEMALLYIAWLVGILAALILIYGIAKSLIVK